jgi:phosphatidylserine/phosphatidylglycerophosphate/cardiolipin synthase-like enzyme
MHEASSRTSAIFDEKECQRRLSDDINGAAGRLLIVSAYATVHAIQRWRTHLEKATKRGVAICAFIQEPRHWDRRHDGTLAADEVAKLKLVAAAVDLLQSLGIHVNLRPKMHEKLIVIDDCILWEGSMNVLSWFNTTERWRRITDRAEVKQAGLSPYS